MSSYQGCVLPNCYQPIAGCVAFAHSEEQRKCQPRCKRHLKAAVDGAVERGRTITIRGDCTQDDIHKEDAHGGAGGVE